MGELCLIGGTEQLVSVTKPYVLEVKHGEFTIRFYGKTLQEAAQKAQHWAKGLIGYTNEIQKPISHGPNII